MKSFYALVRQVHLFAGLILAVAILFYTISGATIAYGKWLPAEPPRRVAATVDIPAAVASNEATLRDFVARQASTRGRTGGLVAAPSGGFRQQWDSPSLQVEAVVAADRHSVTITRLTYGPLRMMRRLHTLTGGGGGLGYLSWRLLLDAVSVAMLLFAATGFILWYRSTKDRRLGWLIFGASWTYTVGLIAWLAWLQGSR